MAIPDTDPPANSLGLDLVHPEHAVGSQSTSASPPSPPQLTTQSSTDTASPTATDATTAATTPVTGTTKTDDATKSNVPKKIPYVNPERVKTGGLPKVNLVSL